MLRVASIDWLMILCVRRSFDYVSRSVLCYIRSVFLFNISINWHHEADLRKRVFDFSFISLSVSDRFSNWIWKKKHSRFRATALRMLSERFGRLTQICVFFLFSIYFVSFQISVLLSDSNDNMCLIYCITAGYMLVAARGHYRVRM